MFDDVTRLIRHFHLFIGISMLAFAVGRHDRFGALFGMFGAYAVTYFIWHSGGSSDA
jgi:hypothetical protein